MVHTAVLKRKPTENIFDEYNKVAINFANKNKSNPIAQVYEGKWNGNGKQNGEIQIVITYNNKTIIVNKSSGQTIDFYKGTDFRGLINLHRIK